MKINKKFLLISIFFFLLIISTFWMSSAKSFVATNIDKFMIFSNDNVPLNSSHETSLSDNFPPETSTSEDMEDAKHEINKKKRIALTFDDGPHPIYTLKLLEGLKERNVKVTFFVIGENAANHPEILKKISEEGHLIGNHTFSHVQLSCVSEEKAIEEINKTNEIIESCTNNVVKFIRPPYGSLPEALENETNLTPVLWTVDPRDWSVLNTNSVVNHIMSRANDGDIILLHDIFETSVDAALIIIDRLSEEGFEFVTVDEILNKTY